MINLSFITFLEKPIKMKVNLTDTLFNAINNVLLEKPHINSLSIKNNEKIYYFGYDLKLNKKFEDYFFQENNNYTICTSSVFDPSSNEFKIEYPILYYNNNKEWPPSDNWNEGDPINLGPFLIWNGYGRGPIRVDKKIDNSYHNLFIIEYNNVKKVLNKFSYILAVMNSPTKSKDPLTNLLIKNECLLKIYEIVQNTKYDKKIIPEIKMEFIDLQLANI